MKKTSKMFDTEEFKKASERFETLGSLGVLPADHKAIGSTPPQRLLDNPGKTLGELMSDEEITYWILGNEKTIKQFSEADPNNSFIKTALPDLKKTLELGKKYLKSIDRL